MRLATATCNSLNCVFLINYVIGQWKLTVHKGLSLKGRSNLNVVILFYFRSVSLEVWISLGLTKNELRPAIFL